MLCAASAKSGSMMLAAPPSGAWARGAGAATSAYSHVRSLPEYMRLTPSGGSTT